MIFAPLALGDELNDITELFILRKLASHSTNPHIMHMIDGTPLAECAVLTDVVGTRPSHNSMA